MLTPIIGLAIRRFKTSRHYAPFPAFCLGPAGERATGFAHPPLRYGPSGAR